MGPLELEPQSCELPCGCWEVNLGPLEKQPEPLTLEPLTIPV